MSSRKVEQRFSAILSTMWETGRMDSPRSGARSVERAMAVLRAIEAGGAGGMRISRVAQRTGLGVSTAHRLARALCEAGLVQQHPVTERYQLGPALVVLGRRAEQALGYDRLRPLLDDLVGETGESANLGILNGAEVLVVLAIASPQPLRYDQEAGSRVPAHASAMGKALLAYTPDPAAAVAALGTLAAYTERTITDPDALLAHLAQVRERGWAVNDGERDPGVRAVAAPVLSPDGRAVAAVALQGPTVRLTDERLPPLAERVRTTTGAMADLVA
jgi:DNA-binding IclR family transcriptional regulator